ncbi:unnamed protein product [Meloidogyne enterolobii]|uniref:Uncharacterized protein n=1 Tax=Meloidogyne enterolobii TaxID=390850 RepID=A0ACB0XNW8_MELEN
MPPLPVVPHQLTKIRSENRVLLVRFAFLFSVCAVFSNIITLTPFHCTKIDVFAFDDPSDVTTAVELSVRRCAPFIVAGCCMDSLGMLSVS